MNKWLLYDKSTSVDGIRSKIYATYIEEPNKEFLKGKDYVITKEEFPTKEGYDTVLYANFVDKCVEVEFAMNDKKVESELTVLDEKNTSQDNELSILLLGNIDLYEMVLGLIPQQKQLYSLNEKGGASGMAMVYVTAIAKGLKTLDQVPTPIRKEVEELLIQMEIPYNRY